MHVEALYISVNIIYMTAEQTANYSWVDGAEFKF